METRQREKEKPWFQVNCKKKQLPRDTRSKPGQQAEKYAQRGFRHHKHAWPEIAKTKHGQDKNGNEKDKRRQTERAPLKPFFVVCLITFPFGGRAQRLPPSPPPAAFLQDSSTFAR